MCRIVTPLRVEAGLAPLPRPLSSRSSAFSAHRLTPSTFLIKEYDDVYSEHPHIYAKLVDQADTMILIDTGCGGHSFDPDIEIKSLRQFIEMVGVEDNDGRPLNEATRLQYVVITSHCHYDHILAVEQFADSVILASGHSPEFVDPLNLPIHSLCKDLGIITPLYSPTLVSHKHQVKSACGGKETGMIIMHTPGHTPDELAIYDHNERMLYVGDTLYEHAPIIFPKEGSIIDWMSSVEYLISFVKAEEGKGGSVVKINAGHETAVQPALEVLVATKTFMQDVLDEREPVRRRMTKRGEETVVYEQEAGRFALICPERLVTDARSC